jgi:hypothetical protein
MPKAAGHYVTLACHKYMTYVRMLSAAMLSIRERSRSSLPGIETAITEFPDRFVPESASHCPFVVMVKCLMPSLGNFTGLD